MFPPTFCPFADQPIPRARLLPHPLFVFMTSNDKTSDESWRDFPFHLSSCQDRPTPTLLWPLGACYTELRKIRIEWVNKLITQRITSYMPLSSKNDTPVMIWYYCFMLISPLRSLLTLLRAKFPDRKSGLQSSAGCQEKKAVIYSNHNFYVYVWYGAPGSAGNSKTGQYAWTTTLCPLFQNSLASGSTHLRQFELVRE